MTSEYLVYDMYAKLVQGAKEGVSSVIFLNKEGVVLYLLCVHNRPYYERIANTRTVYVFIPLSVTLTRLQSQHNIEQSFK